MATDRTIRLYHGTGSYFVGPPTFGEKDILGTKLVSLTASPDLAELFAGSARHGRIFHVDIPQTKILDLRAESEDMSDEGKKRLAALINDAVRGGQYEAVAINNITTGDEDVEYRLLRPLPDARWKVQRSPWTVEEYKEYDSIVRRLTNGMPITPAERRKALGVLKEDIDAELYELKALKAMNDPRAAILEERLKQDAPLYRALSQEPPLKRRNTRRSEFQSRRF